MPLLIYASFLVMKGSDIAMLKAAHDLYDKVASSLWPFVGIALIMRLIYNQVTFGGTRKVAEVLISLFAYTVLILSTPQVLSTIMNSAQVISEKISIEKQTSTDSEKMINQEVSPSIIMSFNDWIVSLSQIWAQMIMTFLESIRVFTLCGLFALAPIFIFMGTILGFTLYRKIFFTLLITVALWPVFSATLGSFALLIFKTKEQVSFMSKAMLLFVYSTLQGILPFLTFQQAMQPVSSGLGAFGGFMGNVGANIGGVKGFGGGVVSGMKSVPESAITEGAGSNAAGNNHNRSGSESL